MKLTQYQIHKDLPQDEVRKIYKKILKNDPIWHFFHEGTYCLIRIHADLRSEGLHLEQYLNKRKIKWDKRPYEDPHELVRKYQHLYQMAFHAFTVIGLEHEPKELASLLERFAHCFCNMAGVTDETATLGNLFIHRMQVNNYYRAHQVVVHSIQQFEKFKRENPDEFEKQFAAIQSPKAGR